MEQLIDMVELTVGGGPDPISASFLEQHEDLPEGAEVPQETHAALQLVGLLLGKKTGVDFILGYGEGLNVAGKIGISGSTECND